MSISSTDGLHTKVIYCLLRLTTTEYCHVSIFMASTHFLHICRSINHRSSYIRKATRSKALADLLYLVYYMLSSAHKWCGETRATHASQKKITVHVLYCTIEYSTETAENICRDNYCTVLLYLPTHTWLKRSVNER